MGKEYEQAIYKKSEKYNFNITMLYHFCLSFWENLRYWWHSSGEGAGEWKVEMASNQGAINMNFQEGNESSLWP
jgi:hypothetical protein